MILRSMLASALGVAFVAGCSPAPDPRPHTATERLADTIMAAVARSDMRPVVAKFVPERRSVLLDPAKVAVVHNYAATGGTFLGARDVATDAEGDPHVRHLVAYYEGGRTQSITITFDDAGKIVHFGINQSHS